MLCYEITVLSDNIKTNNLKQRLFELLRLTTEIVLLEKVNHAVKSCGLKFYGFTNMRIVTKLCFILFYAERRGYLSGFLGSGGGKK